MKTLLRLVLVALVASLPLAAVHAGSAADLSVTKTGAPDPVVAGTDLTYTLVVANSPQASLGAANAALSDTLPAGTTFVSLAQTGTPTYACTSPAVGSGGTVSCNTASVAPGQSTTFTLVVRVAPNVASDAIIFNTASATTSSTDFAPANNSVIATTTVTTSADLQLTKTDSPDPVVAGTNLTYTWTLVNNGPSDAEFVQIIDPIPAGTTFVSINGDPEFSTGFIPNDAFAAETSFAAGATATFTLVVSVDAGTVGPILNTATVSAVTTDPNAANDTATASTTVTQPSADLSVTKTGSPSTAFPGGNITYTLVLTNNGPGTAQTVTLTDAVPAGTTFLSLAQNAGPAFLCGSPAVGGTGNVACSTASLAAGASATFTLVVRINPGASGTISNTASATSATTDATATNNSASALTTLQQPTVGPIPTLGPWLLALLAALVGVVGLVAARRAAAR